MANIDPVQERREHARERARLALIHVGYQESERALDRAMSGAEYVLRPKAEAYAEALARDVLWLIDGLEA